MNIPVRAFAELPAEARGNSARFVGRSVGCLFAPKMPIEIALDRKKREECIDIHGRVRGKVGLHVVEGSACEGGDGCAPFLNPLDDGGCRG